jgi:hypothetical protein
MVFSSIEKPKPPEYSRTQDGFDSDIHHAQRRRDNAFRSIKTERGTIHKNNNLLRLLPIDSRWMSNLKIAS